MRGLLKLSLLRRFIYKMTKVSCGLNVSIMALPDFISPILNINCWGVERWAEVVAMVQQLEAMTCDFNSTWIFYCIQMDHVGLKPTVKCACGWPCDFFLDDLFCSTFLLDWFEMMQMDKYSNKNMANSDYYFYIHRVRGRRLEMVQLYFNLSIYSPQLPTNNVPPHIITLLANEQRTR